MPDELLTIQVRGLSELQTKLREQAPAAARLALRRAVERGGEIMRAEIASNAHRLTGFLEEHIVMKIVTASKGNVVTAIIGPQADVGYSHVEREGGRVALKTGSAHFPAVYARFLEFGTKHQPATPFMGPAFEASNNEALQVFVEELWNGLKELEEK